MDSPELWLTPLLILPGVALLIMSTSVRYARVHDEIDHLLEHQEENINMQAHRLYKRCRLFRNALVSLYSSVTVFSFAGLLGGVMHLTQMTGVWWSIMLSSLGIIFLLFGAIELIRESILSLDVIEEHIRRLDTEKE